jgi:hypothetical protein
MAKGIKLKAWCNILPRHEISVSVAFTVKIRSVNFMLRQWQ